MKKKAPTLRKKHLFLSEETPLQSLKNKKPPQEEKRLSQWETDPILLPVKNQRKDKSGKIGKREVIKCL